ncbi:hypothetical protein N7501_008516 [Penicillium viridicatum]|nr:hypothetical protein N7501_008516 [Penicillium viridicatum]
MKIQQALEIKVWKKAKTWGRFADKSQPRGDYRHRMAFRKVVISVFVEDGGRRKAQFFIIALTHFS